MLGDLLLDMFFDIIIHLTQLCVIKHEGSFLLRVLTLEDRPWLIPVKVLRALVLDIGVVSVQSVCVPQP